MNHIKNRLVIGKAEKLFMGDNAHNIETVYKQNFMGLMAHNYCNIAPKTDGYIKPFAERFGCRADSQNFSCLPLQLSGLRLCGVGS